MPQFQDHLQEYENNIKKTKLHLPPLSIFYITLTHTHKTLLNTHKPLFVLISKCI